VGPHPGRVVVEFALEPDGRAEDGSQDEPAAELELERDVSRH
jgi:hypothetical protein